jgi:hypothetical protein
MLFNTTNKLNNFMPSSDHKKIPVKMGSAEKSNPSCFQILQQKS